MTDTNPLAVLERLAEIEREHTPDDRYTKPGEFDCDSCGQPYPCHAIQLARAVRALVAERDEARRLIADYCAAMDALNLTGGRPCRDRDAIEAAASALAKRYRALYDHAALAAAKGRERK